MLLICFSELIRYSCMSACDISDVEAGICCNLVFSFGEAITTISSISTTRAVSLGAISWAWAVLRLNMAVPNKYIFLFMDDVMFLGAK